MPRTLARAIILASALVLTACVGGGQPPGNRFAQVMGQIPPVPTDRVRFFFYRDYSLYNSDQRPMIALNGQPVAVAEIGGVSYRDVPPGTYMVSVPYSAVYPNKDQIVAAAGGQTVYVKIKSDLWQGDNGILNYQPDIFVVVLVDPAQAQQEIASKQYFP